MSHSIYHLSFGEKFPGQVMHLTPVEGPPGNLVPRRAKCVALSLWHSQPDAPKLVVLAQVHPLDDVARICTTGTGTHKYFLKVVPTEYKGRGARAP